MRSKSVTNCHKWFEYYGSNPTAQMRLFCLPYAGGGAWSYVQWRHGALAQIELCPVHLPGRDRRIAEPPYERLLPLVEALAEVLPTDKPFALFGHSMGALICFELARSLRKRGIPGPLHLLLSGSGAPHLESTRAPRHSMNQEEFISELREFGGTSDDALQDQEMLELFLPSLRADFAVVETYAYAEEPPLSCPITVFTGTEDIEVNLQQPAAWSQYTTGTFTLHSFPGDHFFLQDSRQLVLCRIKETLDAIGLSDEYRPDRTAVLTCEDTATE